jgi:DNA-binding NtrC family response regulator
MPSGRLLLVAADNELRRSLAFALQTEGFSVIERDTPPNRTWLTANRFDCTIADQAAFTGEDYEAIAFCIKAYPVVLMAERPHAWLADWVFDILNLPLASGEVTEAVNRVMRAAA